MPFHLSQLKPGRIALSTRLVVEGHVLNPLWLSSEKRREIRSNVFAKHVGDYILKHNFPAASTAVPSVPDGEPERIYTIWFQGEANAPGLIRTCFDSIRRHCSQELVVLDMESIADWITLPEDIWDKFRSGKIKYAHFSDICRVELLYEHGGYWMDATCFLTGRIPDYIEEQDFFVYRSGHTISGWYSFIQNCFIHARKGSELLAGWRAMMLDFWSKEDKRIDYFQHQLMFKVLVLNDPHAAELFAAMPGRDHDKLHAVWCLRGNEPFDRETYDSLIDPDFFFQKTTYRDVKGIIPGSYRDYILHYGQ